MSLADQPGYLIIARGKDPLEPCAAGDLVDVYPLAAELELDFGAFVDQSIGTHLVAEIAETGIAFARELRDNRPAWRCVRRCVCICKGSKDPRVLATVHVSDSGGVLVRVPPERVPQPFKGNANRAKEPTAWPPHRHPNGSPHVEVTNCRSCRRNWVIVITDTGITPVQLGRPLFSRRVTD